MRSYWLEMRQFYLVLMIVATLAQQFVASGAAYAQSTCHSVHGPFAFALPPSRPFDFAALRKAYLDPEAPSYYAALNRHLEWTQGQIAAAGGHTLLAKNPKGFPYLIWVADGNSFHRMNRVAFQVLRRFEVELVYDPDGLLRDGKNGAYAEEEQRIYVSAKSMELGQPDATLLHEIRHMHYRSLNLGQRSANPLLAASLRATGFEMDSTYYRKYFSLDELSAHLMNLYYYSRSLRQTQANRWNPQDRQLFDIALLRIHDFARQTHSVAAAALTLLKESDLSVRVKSGGLFTKSTQVWLSSPRDVSSDPPAISLREDSREGLKTYPGKFTQHPSLPEKPNATLDFDFRLTTREFSNDWQRALESMPRKSSLFASEPLAVAKEKSWQSLVRHLESTFTLYFEKTQQIEDDSRQLRDQLARGDTSGLGEKMSRLRAKILDLYYP